MFGRAAIRLGVGPHSSSVFCILAVISVSEQRLMSVVFLISLTITHIQNAPAVFL